MALFCAAIRRDSVSLLKFPFLNHIHIFLCKMSLIIVAIIIIIIVIIAIVIIIVVAIISVVVIIIAAWFGLES